jgi:extracellular factor (EF) 3-hydroxypalmitic acid methyl ester biosynthesis protein
MFNVTSRSDCAFDINKKLFLSYLVKNGGPELRDYEEFTFIVNTLDPKHLHEFREVINPILNVNTLAGRCYTKPFGYPGDFYLIDHIYSCHVNGDKKYRNWDIFFQNQAGTRAVRNRKDYFLNQCINLANKKHGEKKVLILGSGPATDVNEFLKIYTGNDISFDLVDFDQNAIDYSSHKNKKFENLISYYKVNVLRFEPYQRYDLIWSAGLFDYFREKHFVYLVKKYINYIAEGGELVIGNFSTENPSKNLMEKVSEWYLNYRSREDLLKIAGEAGLQNGKVFIDAEALEVNLFLKILGS